MGRTGIRTLMLLATLAAAACSRSSAQEYELTGQVLAVDEGRLEITIRHEDIPRFMPGMSMAFKVRERNLLAGLAPGDLVTATLVVEDTDAHLRRLKRTGSAPLPADAEIPARLLAEGDRVTDATFLDRTGAERHIADWRGSVLAVTFIYTRCPVPNFCPLMDRHFKAVQEQVRADPELQGAVRLVSVSIDPQHDTPAVLAAHAAAVGADPDIWEFLTGDPQAVKAFAAQFGLSTLRGEGADEVIHNLRTAVIDHQGRLVSVLNGGDWQPSELVAALRNAHGRR